MMRSERSGTFDELRSERSFTPSASDFFLTSDRAPLPVPGRDVLPDAAAGIKSFRVVHPAAPVDVWLGRRSRDRHSLAHEGQRPVRGPMRS